MKKTFNNIYAFFKKNLIWILLFVCLLISIIIMEDIFEQEIIKIDHIGYEFISTHFLKDVYTPFIKIITNFGSAVYLGIFSIILIIFIKNKKIKILIPLNLIIVTFLNLLLKNIIQRPRPSDISIIEEIGYSFPSGHSMVSMAFYGYLIYLVYIKIKNKVLKWLLISFISILIILIGLSRIYLGVHYTSDVVAGFLLAIAYLIIFIKVTKKSNF